MPRNVVTPERRSAFGKEVMRHEQPGWAQSRRDECGRERTYGYQPIRAFHVCALWDHLSERPNRRVPLHRYELIARSALRDVPRREMVAIKLTSRRPMPSYRRSNS